MPTNAMSLFNANSDAWRDKVFVGSCEDMRNIPDGVANCCVTSPPYWNQRDYGVDGQIGLEGTVGEYIARLVRAFREVRRVLRDDGTVWLNIGDSFFGDSPVRKCAAEAFSRTWDPNQTRSRGGLRRSAAREGDLKAKDLIGIPWALAFALREDGWHLRADVIWRKPHAMPAGRVTDRPLITVEHVFLFTKQKRYYYDNSVKVPDVIEVAPSRYSGAHFATFPPALIRPLILAGCPRGGVTLDPFMGSGTTAVVTREIGAIFTGYELNPDYIPLIDERLGAERVA